MLFIIVKYSLPTQTYFRLSLVPPKITKTLFAVEQVMAGNTSVFASYMYVNYKLY